MTNKYSGYRIGFSEGRSVSHSLGQRLHWEDDVGAGCHDRGTSSRLHNKYPLINVGCRSDLSVGLAATATATAADDHDDDEDKNAANHSSLTANRHVIPPGKHTST